MKRVLDRLYVLLWIKKIPRGFLRRRAGLVQREKHRGKGFQPLLAGNRRTGAALLLIGAVKVLDFCKRRGRVDSCGKLIGQLALPFNCGFDLTFAGFQVP